MDQKVLSCSWMTFSTCGLWFGDYCPNPHGIITSYSSISLNTHLKCAVVTMQLTCVFHQLSIQQELEMIQSFPLGGP